MDDGTITWEIFLNNIKQIECISLELNDNWKLIKFDNEIGHTYLEKHMKLLVNSDNVSNTDEPSEIDIEDDPSITSDNINTTSSKLLLFQYHVLYHISYFVPFLCFNIYQSDGSMVSLDEAWKLFKNNTETNDNSLNMITILTQIEHPILFKPFLTLHPCRTSEILSKIPNSKNKVISFLSAIGPYINLTMDLRYGQMID